MGAYRLVRALGRGGMATVYLALDERRLGVHRLCALKVPHASLRGDRDHADMFLDEARIASQISHPNVCNVLDYGIEEGVPYLVMEYVCGESLTQIGRALAARAPTPGRVGAARAALVARIIADVAAGLHAVHELRGLDGISLGAVHRDVSPDNVMVSCCGPAKLLDFGLVRAAGRHHRTQVGLIKGKLSYLPPEVLEGAEVDRRADVWSLGVTLWEILTGERLFRRASDVETLRAVRAGAITAPSRVRRDVPRPFDEVVLMALAREPARRFSTARELAESLLTAASRRGAHPDVLRVQQLVRAKFNHDDSCAQRLQTEAEAAAADRPSSGELTAITRRVTSGRSTPRAPRSLPGSPLPWMFGGAAAIAACGWLAGGLASSRASAAASSLALVAQQLARDTTTAHMASRAAGVHLESMRLEIVDACGRRILSAPVGDLAARDTEPRTRPSDAPNLDAPHPDAVSLDAAPEETPGEKTPEEEALACPLEPPASRAR